jgi:hypothetical protein
MPLDRKYSRNYRIEEISDRHQSKWNKTKKKWAWVWIAHPTSDRKNEDGKDNTE